MALRNSSKTKRIGVVGVGSFGTAIANMLAEKNEVMVYARKEEVVEEINTVHRTSGREIHPSIRATFSPEELCKSCNILFFMIPSAAFLEVVRNFGPFLYPYHLIIHGTKGLALNLGKGESLDTVQKLKRSQILTMSEVILQETVAVRVGCLAGPNISKELSVGFPAATVIASKYNEVILEGQRLLRSEKFQVYGNSDIIGVELSGVLKNIIAIAAGALAGLGLGENAKGLLVSRGMVEMVHLSKALGGSVQSVMGLAGIGDLVTTCNSVDSRNFTVGFRLAKGESLDQILASMDEVAEGINTIRVMDAFIKTVGIRAPITENLHRVLFEDLAIEDALQFLMKYPFSVDVDFV
ncbi:MAG: NAD(P)H-dependent glycerol-3-phosphate dehydrogenase [Algoriphagus sp.]|jgi:glycerol-3-phosphate dehydrogenase (NAD(P)+)|uniref:NAD(P)H-dependent glycerol-3-phosphate dehydrogenase n=1 Tax=Algoriphagus sp. TaxID=1872435 RepID=UPI0027281B22|nr:NAD(P)H-dependent glycerol-3-phosphate dehydrogenase [Algoriphagus sp.]MDO8966116.1 NAD(P)H-dependent glycerol-3-phosphate dehydrogenase [Algoriphagus sp.]MDP2043004.1 NAD(P)H-dependent glycerol-3-phosphate dehydrogenase [Algoriphagus sp.]MDP3200972.1 NAD(P)H-dependent glycerol-3-phosphate dehydrogenase [Algoriphagus sp.]MDP3472909.1 NAD(P)H-dependent glycerol-3-phosphate dehydrogenase [Algoriphagus sp.]